MIFSIYNYWMAKTVASHVFQELSNVDNNRDSQFNRLLDATLFDLKDATLKHFFYYFQDHQKAEKFHLDYADDELIISVFTDMTRGELATRLGIIFNAFWTEYVNSYFTKKAEKAPAEATICYATQLPTRLTEVEFCSFWQYLLSKNYVGKQVTKEFFLQFQRSDTALIQLKNLDYWLSLPRKTAFEIVKNKPNGRNGKPYRNIRTSLKCFNIALQSIAPDLRCSLNIHILFREYVLQKNILRHRNDAVAFFRFFEDNSISQQDVNDFLNGHGITGIQELLKPKDRRSIFKNDFKPTICWF